MWTRRGVLSLLGQAGGMAGTLAGLEAMGANLRPGPPPRALPPAPEGARVLILGGGIAGLTAAYELEQVGFTVTVIEAAKRLGGRNRTLRAGDKVHHRDGVQTAAFHGDADYFNAGPARLPGFHRNILGYCRKFGVVLEPFAFENQNGFVVSDAMRGGEPVRHRHLRYSAASLTEELVSKSSLRDALDAPLSEEEAAGLARFLDLRAMRSGPFNGAMRGGFAHEPDAGLDGPAGLDPLPLAEIARAPQLGLLLAQYDNVDWQTTLLQPRGGMDRIVEGFARNLDARIELGHEVVAIEQDEAGVTVAARSKRGGLTRYEADYAVAALPLPLLAGIAFAASPRTSAAIAEGAASWQPASKLAWPATRRFWEEDDEIYGGSSMVDDLPMQFWYPSGEIGTATGVLLGAYVVGPSAQTWTRLSRTRQAALSARYAQRMHRGFRGAAGQPIAVDWLDQPFQKGAWGSVAEDPAEDGLYGLLRRLDGRVVLAGDYLSHLSGWQEGAVLSAHHAAGQVAARAHANAQKAAP